MEEYRSKFIDFLLKTGALKVFENPADDRTLKSKRVSPLFLNVHDLIKDAFGFTLYLSPKFSFTNLEL